MPKVVEKPIKSLDDAGDFITIEECSLILGCSTSTVLRYASAGKIKSAKFVGSRRIQTASVRSFVAAALEAA